MRKRDLEAEEQCDGVMTDEEIGKVFGVTRSRVQQMRREAIRKLWRTRTQHLLSANGAAAHPKSTQSGRAAPLAAASPTSEGE